MNIVFLAVLILVLFLTPGCTGCGASPAASNSNQALPSDRNGSQETANGSPLLDTGPQQRSQAGQIQNVDAEGGAAPVSSPQPGVQAGQIFKLPAPRLKSGVSLEESLLKRRSVRDFSREPLALEDISQLLWAGQGVTSENGFRTAPSAGGLYPLEIYIAAGRVSGMAAGLYRYLPASHDLVLVKSQDLTEGLFQAALQQPPVRGCAVNVVITAFPARTTVKYGDRGTGYVYMEAGHAAQNLCLQAAALDLGAVTIGAFEDGRVKSLLGLDKEEIPLYVIPVGHKK